VSSCFSQQRKKKWPRALKKKEERDVSPMSGGRHRRQCPWPAGIGATLMMVVVGFVFENDIQTLFLNSTLTRSTWHNFFYFYIKFVLMKANCCTCGSYTNLFFQNQRFGVREKMQTDREREKALLLEKQRSRERER